ncbi:PREDICTED: uncharacterized protein LOC105313936 isoform X2 [Amphimedon queenslandica]|uniref:MD-2-related lipid-recognition domain-containing protein n=1 Tax=Amphimedon queenslandica TaxID=400682 RepID=A0AAN0JHK4_AMPQE|nr:PREDICTED: uncharacterized protein LOC105313936 isoform X2 [Amphimedon queenslandica]|eukprot:XP_019856138.1 PREDICTED: uncharacterized protein LOC105313936 isoform X2 [Amphimedon queenslandica]
MSVLLLIILTVIPSLPTLTGSTNNYYNEPTDNKGSYTDCCKFSNALLINSLTYIHVKAITHDFGNITNISSSAFNTPIKQRQSYDIQGVINIKKKLQGGILHIIVTHPFKNYINLTFVDAKYNLCDMIVSFIGEYCPLKPGIYHGKFENTIPSLYWPGKYHLKALAYDQNDDEIFCGMMEVDIK